MRESTAGSETEDFTADLCGAARRNVPAHMEETRLLLLFGLQGAAPYLGSKVLLAFLVATLLELLLLLRVPNFADLGKEGRLIDGHGGILSNGVRRVPLHRRYQGQQVFLVGQQ